MRPIDAEPIEQTLLRQADKALAKDPYANARVCAFRLALELIMDAPTIAPPPNDPLTLDELREMDGEPVWISPVKENGKVLARWMLVSGYNPKKDIYLFAPSSNITQGYDGKSYGKTWLAYRRKPEEGPA